MVDELWCEVNFSIVGPRVVFWTVLEWTWRLVVDRDVDRCSGRTTAVVGPNRIRSRAELHDCWNAPNRTLLVPKLRPAGKVALMAHEVIVPEPVKVAFSGKSVLV